MVKGGSTTGPSVCEVTQAYDGKQVQAVLRSVFRRRCELCVSLEAAGGSEAECGAVPAGWHRRARGPRRIDGHTCASAIPGPSTSCEADPGLASTPRWSAGLAACWEAASPPALVSVPLPESPQSNLAGADVMGRHAALE